MRGISKCVRVDLYGIACNIMDLVTLYIRLVYIFDKLDCTGAGKPKNAIPESDLSCVGNLDHPPRITFYPLHSFQTDRLRELGQIDPSP